MSKSKRDERTKVETRKQILADALDNETMAREWERLASEAINPIDKEFYEQAARYHNHRASELRVYADVLSELEGIITLTERECTS